MSDSVPNPDVTRLLNAIGEGSAHAADQLLPLVYAELRRLAAWRMSQERPGQTLQPTALVHEAWLRLVATDQQHWQNRSHFFAAAAEAIRRILVDVARRKQQLKRGGQWQRLSIHDIDLPAATPDERVLLVDDALNELTQEDPEMANIVKLHYFSGLSHEETAAVMGMSLRTVKRRWALAKVWLFDKIRSKE